MPVLTSSVLQATGIAGGDWLILGRLLRENSWHNMVACVPADVVTITRWIIDLSDGTTILSGPTTLVVASTILSALSYGTVFTADSSGFNFRDQVAGSLLASTKGAELQYAATLTDATVVKIAVQLSLKPSN